MEIATGRLLLRPPRARDAPAIFARYASDAEVTRFVGWPRHRSVDDTAAFLRFSDDEWQRWNCGPYLIWSRIDELLLGGTGLSFDAPDRAMTGYVLARDAWGCGYATEALRAMIGISRQLGVSDLYAVCHAEHRASIRVLEKCGFALDGILADQAFPNLTPPSAKAVRYALQS